MRSAYDKLLESKKKQIETMVCYHSLIYSRHRLGIDMHKMMSKEEIKNFKPSAAPLPNYNTDKPGQVECGDRPPRWEKQPRNPIAGK